MKRLQVLLEESEYKEIQELARLERLTLAEWIRQAIRIVRRQKPKCSPERKLAIVRAAMKHSFPTADIDRMLAEIEKGSRGPYEK